MKALLANALQSCVIRGRGPSITAAMKRFRWGSEAACITTVVCKIHYCRPVQQALWEPFPESLSEKLDLTDLSKI
jgi:hypothetical protein